VHAAGADQHHCVPARQAGLEVDHGGSRGMASMNANRLSHRPSVRAAVGWPFP
jgi:hypothetical protein